MAAVIRLYDVEPRSDRPVLPLWTVEEQGFPVEEIPHIGDELKISEWSLMSDTLIEGQPVRRAIPERGETHYWRVVRRTHDLHPRTHLAILGVRYVSS